MMDYLVTGCGIPYQDSIWLVFSTPVVSLIMMSVDTWAARHYDYVIYKLYAGPIAMGCMLWLSVFLPELGLYMGVFATVTVCIAFGTVNPTIDGMLSKNLSKDVAGLGSSMTNLVCGVGNLVLCYVNGRILGHNGGLEKIQYCC